ncbi:glycosyltransferase family 2 protein [Paucihalobacter ruber]|uniref:Glycosyltransferase family 2 protein n=1 Tax=Paucihalobacter ruber TaxID=2567861 RepID=A0A506PPE1_9FLAO|nr:glycosyltransferase family A protein [Paucihalobacter ruber]TPV35746.1 glycosyltransferase family 2 protein [Paucihalobacter ruber]
MSLPIVSILTTVYNREKYLAACIESVLASSFQDWELIIVDDQSKDNSVAIAQGYAARDERIQVYVNETNLGDYPNRNQAAAYAKGTYLKYLDADDLIYPHSLEVMIAAMEQFPDADFGTQYNVRECHQPYPFLVNSRAAFQEHFFGNSFFQSGPTGTIFKREAFFELGGFSGRRYIGDTEMWMKFSLKGPIVVFQPALIWWRQHEEQEFQLGQSIDGYIKLNHQLFWELMRNEDVPLTKPEKEQSIKRYKTHKVRLFFAELLKRRQLKNAIKLYKTCELNWLDLLTILKPQTWKKF